MKQLARLSLQRFIQDSKSFYHEQLKDFSAFLVGPAETENAYTCYVQFEPDHDVSFEQS